MEYLEYSYSTKLAESMFAKMPQILSKCTKDSKLAAVHSYWPAATLVDRLGSSSPRALLYSSTSPKVMGKCSFRPQFSDPPK